MVVNIQALSERDLVEATIRKGFCNAPVEAGRARRMAFPPTSGLTINVGGSLPGEGTRPQAFGVLFFPVNWEMIWPKGSSLISLAGDGDDRPSAVANRLMEREHRSSITRSPLFCSE